MDSLAEDLLEFNTQDQINTQIAQEASLREIKETRFRQEQLRKEKLAQELSTRQTLKITSQNCPKKILRDNISPIGKQV